MRDKIVCKDSSAHVATVQNNLGVSIFKDKNVALFRAQDTVLDCGQGVMVDFPSWKAMREMLETSIPEVQITVKMLLRLAGEAEDEVAAGVAEQVKLELADDPRRSGTRAKALAHSAAVVRPPVKKQKVDSDAWLAVELPEYPNNIRLVTTNISENYTSLLEEVATASFLAYDCQWSPDFAEATDNPIALLQLAFPNSCNTYVLQLPLLEKGCPPQVRRLFETPSIPVCSYAAGEIDAHKFEVTGINIDRSSMIDLQPWAEAEMGENGNVLQGWRVGLKRASSCVLDFEMDKTQTVASSNWEREELTTAQVEYAAMDVWVALRMYQKLAPAFKDP